MGLFDSRYIDFNNPVDRTYLLFNSDKRPVDKYSEIKKFGENLFKVKKDGFYGIVDQTDEPILDCIYEEIDPFYEGMARVKRDGKYGFISEMFVETIHCEYSNAGNFKNGLAKVSYLPIETRFIDAQRKTRVALLQSFDDVSDVVGGLIQIRNNECSSCFVTDKNEPYEDGKKYYEVTNDGKYWYGETGYIKYKFNKFNKQQVFKTEEDEPDNYSDWLRQN